MRAKKLRPPKIQLPRKPRHPDLPAPARPATAPEGTQELLTGEVNGMKASAAEERFYNTLSKIKAVDSFEFRYTTLPRNVQDFKEADYVVQSHGIIYAIEIDSPFTHQGKQKKDQLHDSIILNHFRGKGYMVYPNVPHIEGEVDLANQKTSDALGERMFGV